MTVEHKSLRDEILFILGRSSSPLDSGQIYERCELAEEIKRVSDALWVLRTEGKIAFAAGEGRKRYVLAKGVATPAPAGKAGRPAADPGLSLDGAAGSARRAPDAPSAGVQPAVESDPNPLPVVDIPTLGEAAPPACPDPVEGLFDERVEGLAAGSNAERLADAIIARLKRQLAPTPCELEAAAGLDRLSIHIHIEQVDFHLGGL